MPSGELVGTTLKLTTGQEVTDGHSHFPTLLVKLQSNDVWIAGKIIAQT
jgi:hypothetical protein